MGKTTKFIYEDVKKFIEENSKCILLSTEYISNNKNLELRCGCGSIFKVDFWRFKSKNKRACNDCMKKPPSNKLKYDECMNSLKSFVEDLGHIPKKREYVSAKIKPNITWFDDHCGGFRNALVEIGVLDKILTYDEKLKISLDEFAILANEIGRAPYAKEYKKHLEDTDGLSFTHVCKTTGLSYNQLCQKYLPEFGINRYGEISYEEIVANIHKCVEQLGKTPTYKEYKEFCNGKISSIGAIKRTCNKTFLELLEHLGYKSESTTTKTIPPEIALQQFKDLALSLGRIPVYNEISADKSTISWSSYIKYFGSIDNVVKILNLEHLERVNYGYGYTSNDNNGEVCRSTVECIITNYLIDNEFEYEKETSYSKIIPKCKYRFDWRVKIDDKLYYVEYFGMYDEKSNTKNIKFYREKTHKKIKLLYENKVIDQCIFIFPDDLKNKTLDEIFKRNLDLDEETRSFLMQKIK